MLRPKPQIRVVVSEMFAENTYIVNLEGRSDCLVIDPGLDHEGVIAAIQEAHLTPVVILNTHGHADHIAGNEPLKRCWPECPLIIGSGDAEKLTDAVKNLSRPFGMDIISPPADSLVNHGDVISFAGFELEVRECPGHSIGHVVFVWKAGSPCAVFGGDVLFQGSIGRTDFPDGSFDDLARAIREHLYCLPDNTVVYPGHGDPTLIGVEKQTNPFVRAE